jgi:hypothetical protein
VSPLFDRLKTQQTMNGELCTIYSRKKSTYLLLSFVAVAFASIVVDGVVGGLTVADMVRIVELWDIKFESVKYHCRWWKTL